MIMCHVRRLLAPLIALSLLQQSCASASSMAAQALEAKRACAAIDALSDDEVTHRLQYIELQLQAARGPTRAWFITWLSLLGAASLGQIALLVGLPDKELKIDAAVGAVGTTVAIVPLLLSPRRALTAYDEFDAARTPDAADRRARLCKAETLLEGAAQDAAGGASWLAHLSGDAAAVVLGAVQWGVFHHRIPGAFTAVAGTVGNELLVLTQPTAVVNAWDDYKNTFRPTHDAGSPALSWRLNVTPTRVVVGVDF